MENIPAAHSMDTYWFATDEEGNVALFETGEQGAVPVPSACYLPEELLVKVLYSLGQTDPRIEAMLPESPWELERALDDHAPFELVFQLLGSLGVWIYVCEDQGRLLPEPYFRIAEVSSPLLVGELTRPIQRYLEERDAQLPLRFRDKKVLVPAAYRPTHGWREHSEKPLRNKEARQAEKAKPGYIQVDEEMDLLEGEALYEALEDLMTAPPLRPWERY